MTTSPGSSTRTAPPAGQSVAPQVSWPLKITEQQAMRWVRRRLPDARGVRLGLYHHPMLGAVFQWRRPVAKPLLAHCLVDLVGGRAYAAEHWDDVDFVPIDEVAVSPDLRPPAPAVSLHEARDTARRLVSSVMLRRRRLDVGGRLVEHGEPLLFGKPNWWVQAVSEKREVEVVIDGLTGNHYVFTA